MKQDFAKRVSSIDWTAFQTAYGRADKVPDQLNRLASLDHKVAMAATHELWCGLCHQHAFISSAALPAFPFIIEVLETADEQLTIEILDIITGFAFCSTQGPGGPSPNQWERELRRNLLNHLPRFKTLSLHNNEEIAGFAERIFESLTKYSE